MLNLKNGVFNLTTKQFGPHSHEYLTPIHIPVDWDDSATCPAWEWFISQTLPPDCQRLVWEIAAWLITPYVSQQKAVMLIAPGGNGKSVLIDGLTKFIGREYIANKTLHQLEEDPKSSDATDGFHRLWIILPFLKSFEGSAGRRSKRELDADLQAPAEMSGLLRCALHHLIGLRKRGFSESAAAEALEEFREVPAPLTGWLNRRTQNTPEVKHNGF